jgi:hypothetical protein
VRNSLKILVKGTKSKAVVKETYFYVGNKDEMDLKGIGCDDAYWIASGYGPVAEFADIVMNPGIAQTAEKFSAT